MIVEVIAVGTELLLGQVVNTNAAFLGAKLAENGFDAHFSVAVGDNLDRLAAQIELTAKRADAIILTGGLGPTRDDLTREALARVTGRPMRFDAAYAEELRARFQAIGRIMPESNLRQAESPEGAVALPNPKGTAPGLAMIHDSTWIFALPGVPGELEPMVSEQVLPRLEEIRGTSETLVSRVLRTWGRSEAAVAQDLDDIYLASSNPSLAFLASAGEIKVRITAKAATREAALDLIAPVEEQVRRRLGTSVYGTDAETIEEIVLRSCEAKGWTLATAESATGGMVAARLTSVAGSSRVFRGGIVSYAIDLKTALLGVSPETLVHGLVSEPVATAMAEGGAGALGADVVVAVTGSAGPDQLEQPPGTMVVAVRTPEGLKARTLRLPGDRERVRAYTATSALHLTRLAVEGAWW